MPKQIFDFLNVIKVKSDQSSSTQSTNIVRTGHCVNSFQTSEWDCLNISLKCQINYGGSRVQQVSLLSDNGLRSPATILFTRVLSFFRACATVDLPNNKLIFKNFYSFLLEKPEHLLTLRIIFCSNDPTTSSEFSTWKTFPKKTTEKRQNHGPVSYLIPSRKHYM